MSSQSDHYYRRLPPPEKSIRSAELKNWVLLAANGCAAPLLCTFANGIVCGYSVGETLTVHSVRLPDIYSQVCATMARMHAIELNSNRLRRPMLFTKLAAFIDNLPASFAPDQDKQQRFIAGYPSVDQLRTEFACLERIAKAEHSPVVLCHNDLLLNNILYDAASGSVHFIDYEYADFNYQAYDIAGHFCEFVGVDDIDWSLYPDKTFQLEWLKQYLTCWNEAAYNNRKEPSAAVVEELYTTVNRFAGIAHFFWSVQAIIQAKNSTIDFDFLQYGIDRMGQYRSFKERFLSDI